MGEYVLPKVKAKFKYARQNEDELQFEKGAIIQVCVVKKVVTKTLLYYKFYFLIEKLVTLVWFT